ncbi:MAG: porin [Ectothiorhodospiraceae bacterium]|nr:porin [Ectothiorhodospiraceae bacterium]MCH8505165.1 porin [Ectothiorhodospiraceae bacterium]
MKSAVIAGAGAAMLASGNALAVDVQFSGIVDVWAGVQDPDAGDRTWVLNSGGMSTSYFGVNISHEISPGLTGFANLQMFYRPDTGDQGRFDGDNFFARAAHVGVAGSLGRISAGRNTNPYFISTILFNAFGDSFVFSPTVLHTFGGGPLAAIAGDSGWSDSISYGTPTINGFNANLIYAFGEVEDEPGDNKMGANAFYRAGGFAATLAVQAVDYTASDNPGLAPVDADGDTQTSVLVGASYDFGFLKLFGQYQNISDDRGPFGDLDTFSISAAVPAGPGSVLLAVAYSDYDDFPDADDRTTASIGYMYPLSQYLDTYAAFLNDDWDGDTDRTFGVGARYRF